MYAPKLLPRNATKYLQLRSSKTLEKVCLETNCALVTYRLTANSFMLQEPFHLWKFLIFLFSFYTLFTLNRYNYYVKEGCVYLLNLRLSSDFYLRRYWNNFGNFVFIIKKMLLAVFNFVLYESIIVLLQWLHCGLKAQELELESVQSDQTLLFIKTAR